LVSDDGLYFYQKETYLLTIQKTKLFANCKSIAIHSEKEEIVEANEQVFREQYGEDVPVKYHPIIRVPKAVMKLQNVRLIWLKKHNARLHILHLTTEAETHLFQNDMLKEKK
jgi:dihydroorotase